MKLTVARPGKCVRTLAPGEGKRVLGAGPLVGYYIACPGCRNTVVVLKDGRTMTESEPGKGLTFEPGEKCRGCGKVLLVRDGEFVDAPV